MRRRGVSIVEILIVMSIGSVIVGTTITTLHLLLRSERDQARGVRTASTTARLAQVFREDVHAMREARIIPAEGDEPERLQLTDALGARVEYAANGHVLTRIDSRGAGPHHQEAFHFPLDSSVQFDQQDQSSSVAIALRLAAGELGRRAPDAPARPGRSLRLEATLGRDFRFEGSQP
ncbi:MAG: prepilin-type N-terminal cleavage/methylation domain-containing protein [Planctomycetales bacterium]